MPDSGDTLERQRRWQQGRAALSWAEKVRMAARIRESVRALRATARKPQDEEHPSPPAASLS